METFKECTAISQQLMLLRHANLVFPERRGPNVYYHINYSQLKEIERTVSALLSHDPAL